MRLWISEHTCRALAGALLCIAAISGSAVAANEDRLLTTIPDSTNRVMKVLDSGVAPATVELFEPGSSVFFLNSTTDDAITIEVNYGTKLGYCATGDMKMNPDGVFRSQKTFGPGDFIVVCFPQPGEYPVTVKGLKSRPQGAPSTVVVRAKEES